MPERRLPDLPIDAVLSDIVERARSGGALVLQAPPGAGKTTRVPPALLDAGVRGQDRRAPAAAARGAARGAAHGRGAGRAGRGDGRLRGAVRARRFAGDADRARHRGILTRRLVADPELRGVGAVILDEFHERHLQGDVALALLASLRKTRRPDLVLVVMSATLDAAPVAAFLGAPIVREQGAAIRRRGDARARGRRAPARIAGRERDPRALQAGTTGDVLVFLPGAAEIRRADGNGGAAWATRWGFGSSRCTAIWPPMRRTRRSKKPIGRRSSSRPTSRRRR